MVPLIDMETSLTHDQVLNEVGDALGVMDDIGMALMAPDGYQRAKDGQTKGYRWSSYILGLVNRYPGRFAPTANGGTNPNWLQQKGGKSKHYIDKLQKHVRTGVYAHMGELDFRHYMSNSQCKQGKTHRDSDIALNRENGHRLFKLAAETRVPFVVHLEPEDQALATLEEMLATYPDAPVIVAHFGQIRHPEKQQRFGPDLVRRLFGQYPNLYYDLAAGGPGRRYKCSNVAADTVIWDGPLDGQRDHLHAQYKALLTEFSDRFVMATDFGGGRKRLSEYLREKVALLRLIIRDLPDDARHNIGYRNAWKLLTGEAWSG
ncbi:MAG: amidohydrolase family protein [Rhodospirillaceae bacterium]|nr:amidohydrolase family protein [Rhodospirillaceae bacterium]